MDCKGCRTSLNIKKYYITKKCIIVNNSPQRNCPCQRCLVKSSCKVQCEDFINLIKSIHAFKTISYNYKNIQAGSYGFPTINPAYERVFPEI